MNPQENPQAPSPNPPSSLQPQILFENSNGSEDDLLFDSIVGALQDTVMEEEFGRIQDKFMRLHCGIFQDKEENKMEYMGIFNQYQQVVQKYILNSLTQKLPWFTNGKFSQLLATRTEQIDQDLLQIMNSFSDFEVFKQLMLEHKEYYGQEQKFQGLCVKGAVCKLG